jgi:hypothetical protein
MKGNLINTDVSNNRCIIRRDTSNLSNTEIKNYNLLFDIGESNYADISGPIYGFNYMKNDSSRKSEYFKTIYMRKRI